MGIRNVFREKGSEHGRNRSKLAERLYKLIMIFGLGIAYKGFKGWLKSKKRRMSH